MAVFDAPKNAYFYKIIEQKDEEILLLKEQIMFLQEQLKVEEDVVPLCFRLTRQQAILLLKLYKNQGRPVSCEMLLRSLYELDIDDTGTMKRVNDLIYLLRNNIKKYGLVIENHRGAYSLSKFMSDRLAGLLEQHKNCSLACTHTHE